MHTLISHGASIHGQDKNGQLPLHIAVREGFDNIANKLINNGSEFNMKDRYGKTPLMWASEIGKLKYTHQYSICTISYSYYGSKYIKNHNLSHYPINTNHPNFGKFYKNNAKITKLLGKIVVNFTKNLMKLLELV